MFHIRFEGAMFTSGAQTAQEKKIKLKRRQKCNSTLSPWIVFRVMANPDPLFELPDLIACVGIASNAFEADYTSPEDLYTRSLREKANYARLGRSYTVTIFSNSIDVLNNSYQASFAADLLEFVTEEAKKDRPFLAAHEDFLFVAADEHAPIDLTEH
ncbi:hypothetical protein VTI74DRAFT_5157 [Chaetomium olivicolor]